MQQTNCQEKHFEQVLVGNSTQRGERWGRGREKGKVGKTTGETSSKCLWIINWKIVDRVARQKWGNGSIQERPHKRDWQGKGDGKRGEGSPQVPISRISNCVQQANRRQRETTMSGPVHWHGNWQGNRLRLLSLHWKKDSLYFIQFIRNIFQAMHF